MDPDRRVLHDGAVLVEGERITAVGDRRPLLAEHPDAEVVNCQDRLVLPGLVNTHTHLFQTLLKGLGDDMVLKDWFDRMTGPSAAALTPPDVRAAARHGAVEAIRSGTTTVADFMYVHPVPGLTREVVEGLADVGVRGVVGRGYMTAGADIGVPPTLVETVDQALEDASSLIREYNADDDMIRVGLAPAMIWTVDEPTLLATREVADAYGALIMMHVSETDFEVGFANEHYGVSDVEALERAGLLGPDLLAVHCVKCSRPEIDLLARTDTKVSHNPCSNLYLASGVPPIPAMLRAGLAVGLASDGPASNNNQNLVQTLKFAALMQKGHHHDATIMTAETVLEMATLHGAQALGLDTYIGSLEPGKQADIAVFSFDNAFVTPLHDPVSALVYSATGTEATTVLINGRIVMHEGMLTTVDEEAVRAEATDAARQVTARAGTDQLAMRPWRSVSTRGRNAGAIGR